jgi:hypothetical protein
MKKLLVLIVVLVTSLSYSPVIADSESRGSVRVGTPSTPAINPGHGGCVPRPACYEW